MLNLEEQLMVAIKLATNKHDGQYDKCGIPYILHPTAVAAGVASVESKIVAYLHDVLEDTNCSVALLLASGIDTKLVDAVIALTHDKKTETDREYWIRVKKNSLALQVKLADIQHNLSRLDGLVRSEAYRLNKKYVEALLVLESW